MSVVPLSLQPGPSRAPLAGSADGPAAQVAKRAVDLGLVASLLLLLLPVLLLAAIWVRFDSTGPAFFSQTRVGLDGRRFRVHKLRTMRVDGDDAEHRRYVASLIVGGAEQHGGMYKLVHDPRVTRAGRFLRKYSVDELPQLWNVLKGEMSLVGPRPALPHEVALYDRFARQRLAVKPGLTGLWQVSGRCELDFNEALCLDVSYAQQRSLLLDLKIIARTPGALLSARGAA